MKDYHTCSLTGGGDCNSDDCENCEIEIENRTMPFRNRNPEVWDNLIKGYGYICPECGNRENFQQYWHIVKDVRQNPETGIIEWMQTHLDVVGNQPQIVEVICNECGATALICGKGVLLDTLNHEDYNKLKAEPIDFY